MKSIIAMLFLSALAVYARAEMEYHPQAILSYLEMEDREMARKVRSQLKLNDIGPSVRPSILPTGKLPILPTGKVPSGLPAVMPPKMVSSYIFQRIELFIVCFSPIGHSEPLAETPSVTSEMFMIKKKIILRYEKKNDSV